MTATGQRRFERSRSDGDRFGAPLLGEGEMERRPRLLERDDPAVGPLLHAEDVDPVPRREGRG